MFEPVGPLPPSVYWRRRVLALGVVTFVVIAVMWSVATTTSPPPRPAIRPQAMPAPTPATCADEAIRVDVEVGQPAYRVGDVVTLVSVVTNISDQPCLRDTGRMFRELVVSGSDGVRLWSSNDCFWESSNEYPLLLPGQSARNETRWAGHTSSPECLAERETAGSGEYHAVARLGAVVSAPTAFLLI